jgi:hypothetical protein
MGVDCKPASVAALEDDRTAAGAVEGPVLLVKAG